MSLVTSQHPYTHSDNRLLSSCSIMLGYKKLCEIYANRHSNITGSFTATVSSDESNSHL